MIRAAIPPGKRRRDDGPRGRFTSRPQEDAGAMNARHSRNQRPRSRAGAGEEFAGASLVGTKGSRSPNSSTTTVLATTTETGTADEHPHPEQRHRRFSSSKAALLPPRLQPLASSSKEVVSITVLSEDNDAELASLDVSRFLVADVPEGGEASSGGRSAGQVYRRPSAISGSESEDEEEPGGDDEDSITGTVAATAGGQVNWAGPNSPGSEAVDGVVDVRARMKAPPPPDSPRRRISASSRNERMQTTHSLAHQLSRPHSTALPPLFPPSANRRHYRSFLPLQHRLLHQLEAELSGLESLLISLDDEIELEEQRERTLDDAHRHHDRNIRDNHIRHSDRYGRDYDDHGGYVYGRSDPHAYLSDLLHRRSGLLAHIEVTMKRYGDLVDSMRKWALISRRPSSSSREEDEKEHDIVDILSDIDYDSPKTPKTPKQMHGCIPFSLPLLATFALTIALLPNLLWRLGMIVALAVWMLVVAPLIGPWRIWTTRMWHIQLLRLRRFDWLRIWAIAREKT